MVTLMAILGITAGLLAFGGIYAFARRSLRHDKQTADQLLEEHYRMQGARRGRI
jgi:hypothetical protein